MAGREAFSSRAALAGLVAALAIAGVLRFAHLDLQGLVYWDEGKFALEGLRLESALRAFVGGHVDPSVGKTVGTAKPSHAFLIACAYFTLGVHDYSPLAINAAFSLIEIALLYGLGLRLFGLRIALPAAFFLAVSEYDIIYARSALSESDAACVFLAGVLVWAWPRWSGAASGWTAVLVSAALLGLSFTINYRMSVYIAALVIFDLLQSARVRGARVAGRRLAAWLTGLLAAPLLWQLADLLTRAGGLVLFRSEVTGLPVWYVQQALYQLHEGKQSAVHFSPLPYLQWFLARQGWVPSILLLAGMVRAVRERERDALLPAVLVVFPYLAFTFAPFYVPRNLVAALPFAALLSALGLEWACRSVAGMVVRTRRGPPEMSGRLAGALVLVLAVAVSAVGGLMSWRLSSERSGFARAAGYMSRHGGRALTSTEIMVFYLSQHGGSCRAPALPNDLPGLAAYRAAGYRYAVLERHASSVSRAVRRHSIRVARFPALGSLSLGENLISSENSHPPQPSAPPDYVDVYDLGRMRIAGPGFRDPGLCNQNTPV